MVQINRSKGSAIKRSHGYQTRSRRSTPQQCSNKTSLLNHLFIESKVPLYKVKRRHNEGQILSYKYITLYCV